MGGSLILSVMVRDGLCPVGNRPLFLMLRVLQTSPKQALLAVGQYIELTQHSSSTMGVKREATNVSRLSATAPCPQDSWTQRPRGLAKLPAPLTRRPDDTTTIGPTATKSCTASCPLDQLAPDIKGFSTAKLANISST